MKRGELIRHLNKNRCTLMREGANHSVFLNSLTNRISSVPRHNEIDNNLCKKICRDLGIEKPNKK